MDLPLTLIVLSIPSLIYIAVRRRRRETWNEVFHKIGWQGCRPVHYLWSLGITILVAGLGWLAIQTVPAEILEDPNINISGYAGLTLSVPSILLVWFREALYIALGEEIFFRGFLGGWLIRQFGFAVGNTIQALVFLLPHLLLLLVSQSLWPVIIVQLVAGWLLGWLRYRSDSILPGWLAHSLTNTLGALAALR